MSRGRTFARGGRGPDPRLDRRGEAAVADGVHAPRSGVLDQQERADRRGRARDGVARARARRRSSGSSRQRSLPDLEQAFPDEAARQHEVARGIEPEVGGREGLAVADHVDGARRSGPAPRRSGRRSSSRSRSPTGLTTQGRPARRRSTVSGPIRSTASTSWRPPRSRLLREVRKRWVSRSTAVGGVDVGQREGQGLEPVDETGGQLVAVTDPAGGQVLLVDLVEQPVDGPAHQAAPGQLVDADRHVEAGVVLRAGGVRGAGRQVHGEARAGAARRRRGSRPRGPRGRRAARRAGGAPPTAWCRGSGRRTRRGCRCAPRSPASPAA